LPARVRSVVRRCCAPVRPFGVRARGSRCFRVSGCFSLFRVVFGGSGPDSGRFGVWESLQATDPAAACREALACAAGSVASRSRRPCARGLPVTADLHVFDAFRLRSHRPRSRSPPRGRRRSWNLHDAFGALPRPCGVGPVVWAARSTRTVTRKMNKKYHF